VSLRLEATKLFLCDATEVLLYALLLFSGPITWTMLVYAAPARVAAHHYSRPATPVPLWLSTTTPNASKKITAGLISSF
jgi:hypothetical protein